MGQFFFLIFPKATGILLLRDYVIKHEKVF